MERVSEINNLITRGADSGTDDKLRSAAMYEEQRDYRNAIKCYLSLTDEDVESIDKLVEF